MAQVNLFRSLLGNKWHGPSASRQKFQTKYIYRITLATKHGPEVHASHNPICNFLLNKCTSEIY